MGLSDILSDIYTSLSFTEVHAEAPPEEEEKDDGGDDDKADSDDKEGEEGGDEEGAGGGDEGGDEEEEEEEEEEGGDDEEEEEEEEPVDPFPKLQEECSKTTQCAPLKHHYDDCAERVTAQHSDPDHKGPKEDCVEEFFHLSHCATQCAAPKLFRQLK